MVDRLDVITCPTFVGSGQFDGIAPVGNGEAIASRGTEGRLARVPGRSLVFRAGCRGDARDHRLPPFVSDAGGAFVSLRTPAYRLLWTSGLFVFLSVTAQTIARGWLARQITGTNAGLGGVLLAFGVPSLILSPWGGVAADRLPKRTVIVISEILLTVSALWIGIAVAVDAVEYWMLLATSAIQAAAFALFGPARMAFTAELVEAEDLTNAVSLGQMSAEGMRVIGPSIAGVLLAAGAFGGEGDVSRVRGALRDRDRRQLLVATRRTRREPTDALTVEEMREGLSYVRRNHYLLLLIGASLGVVMLGFPYMAFLPSVADGMFDVGAGGYGLMSAVTSIGAVGAALVAARRASRAPTCGSGSWSPGSASAPVCCCWACRPRSRSRS